MKMKWRLRPMVWARVFAPALLLAACRQDMYNQPRTKPYSQTNFFADETEARPLPPHTVIFHTKFRPNAFYTGLAEDGTLVAQIPVAVTPQLLQRGRERFDINCAVCHGLTGQGNGEVVQRGFPAPPSYSSQRLRNAPIGHFYDVITNGYGVMYSYASRVAPEDRWAIAAYIRALQLSQHASPNDLSAGERAQLEKSP